jgi:actin-related protein 8
MCGTGLERTDNNLELTTWPQVNMINQKNYYTFVTLHLYAFV